jgi:hypothetical protein
VSERTRTLRGALDVPVAGGVTKSAASPKDEAAHVIEVCAGLDRCSVGTPIDDWDRQTKEFAMPGFLKYIIFLNMLGMLAGTYY